MTIRYNAANAKKMHELGIEFCLMHLKCKRHGHRIYMPDGSEVQIHTQNTMGEAFTLWVSFKDNFAQRLQSTAHIFVNYGDTGTVSAHFLEKPTHDTYRMEYVGKDSIALIFDGTKTTELVSVSDREVWSQFRKYSSARKFNLNSPHYATA